MTATDPAVDYITGHLADWLHDLDDSGDAPFGYFAVVEHQPTDNPASDVLVVSPDQDSDDPPSTPVVRITVERIA